jgi:O-succinylbenzoate synthase
MTTPRFEDMTRVMHCVALPLVTAFRGISAREIVIFEGPDGPAEWSPFPEYDDAEAATWLRCTLEQGWQQKSLEMPLDMDQTIGVNGTLPALPAAEVAGFLANLGSPSTVKIKVGGPGTTLSEDIARVSATRDALGPAGRIRLDANGTWTLDEAEHAIRQMESYDVDYVEQPVSSLADMAELRRRIQRLGIQVAADESIRRSGDIAQVLALEACDVAVIKVQPLGGIARARAIIDQARQAGVDVVVSSALESSVGVHYGAQLQQLLAREGGFPLDAGLGTVSLFAGDVVRQPLIAHTGTLQVTPPVLEPAALKRYAMPKDRRDWWTARLKRCRELV